MGDTGGLVSGDNVIQLSHLKHAKKKEVRAYLDKLIKTIKTYEYIQTMKPIIKSLEYKSKSHFILTEI